MAKQREKKNPLFGAISRLLHRRHSIEVEPRLQPGSDRLETGSDRLKPVLHKEHPRKTEPDIPFDRLERAYTPTQTSLKASFRATGEDRQRDQEFADGYADERWSEEDRFTNKSGDPRIGTHGRTYEPGERRRR